MQIISKIRFEPYDEKYDVQLLSLIVTSFPKKFGFLNKLSESKRKIMIDEMCFFESIDRNYTTVALDGEKVVGMILVKNNDGNAICEDKLLEKSKRSNLNSLGPLLNFKLWVYQEIFTQNYEEHVIYIDALAVEERYRSRHIGKKLIEIVIQKIKQDLEDERTQKYRNQVIELVVASKNHRAIAFYIQNGFRTDHLTWSLITYFMFKEGKWLTMRKKLS